MIENDATSLTTLSRAVWRYKPLIFTLVAIFSVLSAVVALILEPTYRAQVLLAAVEEESAPGGLEQLAQQFGGAASLAGINIGSRQGKNESIARLRSRLFTLAFIKEHDLMPVLFADKWDEATGGWSNPDPEDWPTEADAYRLFDEEARIISVSLDTGLVTLSIDWSDRTLAANWANMLVQDFNNHVRQIAIAEANTRLGFLRRELESTSNLDLRQVL